MTCPCGSAPRGFAWQDLSKPAFDRPAPTHACSMTCLKVVSTNRGDAAMLERELNKVENEAVAAASAEAGAYLERIGKTDLTQMTEAEWLGFIGHAFGAVSAEVRKLWKEDCPF